MADSPRDDQPATGLRGRWARLRQTPWIRTTLRGWQQLGRTNGGIYAGAITYFSFLALFPLILLAVSVLGFVLHTHPALLQSVFDRIATSVPGSFGTTLTQAIRSAVAARTGVGLIGVAGVLSTGLGWIGNLRTALDAIWEVPAPKQNPVVQRLVNLGVLVTLGVAVLASVALTAVGTALADTVVRGVGLDGVTGVGLATRVLGIAVAVAADVVLFWAVLVRLPHVEVPRRFGLQSAVLAAIGFEVLKVVGTYTIAASSSSPTAGPFASIIAVLVWIQLVVRMVLFCAAVSVVRTRDARLRAEADLLAGTPPAPTADELRPAAAPALSPAAVGVGLVGAGAVTGAALTAWLHRSRPGADADAD